MELVPHDVIEYHILERLDVKTLVKFKSVSKQWNCTIQSPSFQNRQHRRLRLRGGDPDVLLVSVLDSSVGNSDIEALRTLVLGSSSASVQILTPWEENTLYLVCNTSCDGLIWLYDFYRLPSIVVNPTTRWHRTFPLCNYQLVAADKAERDETFEFEYASPGFGKDKISGTYKQVLDTSCEVFDFATNAWRYVVPASPHLISHMQSPVYLDGSLHWFSASSHEAPFLHANELKIVMCILDDCLCVSEEKGFNQVIWSFHHKTWNQIYSIDISITSSMCGVHILALLPLAVLDKNKNNKLLFYAREDSRALVTHDPKTKSYGFAYQSNLSAY
ncbi:hypothetical protein EUTSA_v10021998mg, partial [Eutrema salsugineum]